MSRPGEALLRRFTGSLPGLGRQRTRTPFGVPAAADLYVAVFALVVGVAVVLSLVADGFSSVDVAGLAGWVPWALAVGWTAAVAAGCSAAGPAHAGPALIRWLLGTPLDRHLLLRPGLLVTGGGAVLAGATGGAAVWLAAGTPAGPGAAAPTAAVPAGAVPGVAVLGGAVLTGALTGLAVHQLALAVQARHGSARPLGAAATVVLLLTCVLITADVRAPGTLPAPPALPAPTLASPAGLSAVGLDVLGLGVLGLGVLGLAALGWSLLRTRAWTQRLDTPTLRAAGEVVSAVTESTVMMDEGRLSLLVQARSRARRAVHRSRGPGGGPLTDLVLRDVRGALRRRRELIVRVGLAALAWATGAVLGALAALPVAAGVAWLVGAATSLNLRTWLESASLWRAFPQSPTAVAAAFTVVPLLLATGTALLCAAGAGISPGLAAVVGVAVAAGLVRRCQQPPMQAGAVLATPAGGLPLGIVKRLLHGPDLTAGCLLLAVVAGWPLGLGASAVAMGSALWRSDPRRH